jgi:hypothetical protein
MQELINAIHEASNGVIIDFTEVAVKWASYCLRNLKDEMLVKGLDIAGALSQFDTALKDL